MWNRFARFANSFHHFGLWEWLAVFAVAVVIGVMCMKGFGSRSNY